MDITERKRAEAEAEQQRRELAHLTRVSAMGVLSGALAHELNQPLTAILSNAQTAARLISRTPIDTAEIASIIDDIVADNKRAGQIIQHLRSLLKKDTAEKVPLAINDVILDVLAIYRSDLIFRGVAVSRRLSDGLPEILGDPIQLQQVILNLIMNACDAMDVIPREDRLLVITSELDGPAIRISITDLGHGIPASAIDKVHQPFFTTKTLGLGLGLPICNWILEAHGGRLVANNNPDRGTTFAIVLPIGKELPHDRAFSHSVSG